MQDDDRYELQQLTSERVSFSRSPGGMLQGIIDGVCYSELLLFRAFPHLYPERYISVRDRDSKEIGVIDDLQELDEESRVEVESELRKRYFLPRVTHIQGIIQKDDIWMWSLVTDVGELQLVMHNLHDYVQLQGESRVILTDISGRRCEIADRAQLDARSRRWLKEVL